MARLCISLHSNLHGFKPSKELVMFSISHKLQLTMAILKPHLVANPIALEEVKNMILTSNFKVVKSKQMALSQKRAEDFYTEHREKFFYNRLVTFMSSGKSFFCILAHENAINEWRNLMGPTKVYKTQFEVPNSIRGRYGLSDTRNASHGSDSVESASREIKFFFPDFHMEDWYLNDEEHFRQNKKIKFLEHEFLHVIDNI